MSSVLINAFPKSGLHLAELMIKPLRNPARQRHNWVADLAGNSWTTHQWGGFIIEVAASPLVLHKCYMKGHLTYAAIWADWLDRQGIKVLFVTRDLRDVLVSQAHHILSERNPHPGRANFSGDVGKVMVQCLEGVGVFAGLFDRWAQFRGWLDRSGVLVVDFADMVQQPEATCERVVSWLGESRDKLPYMLQAMARKDTPTFRNGMVGEWRQYWTPEIAKAWKDARRNQFAQTA